MGISWIELEWAARARQQELLREAEWARMPLPARRAAVAAPAVRRRVPLGALTLLLSRMAAAGRA